MNDDVKRACRPRRGLRAAEVHGNMQVAMTDAARALRRVINHNRKPEPLVSVRVDKFSRMLVCPCCGDAGDLPASYCKECGQKFLTNVE